MRRAVARRKAAMGAPVRPEAHPPPIPDLSPFGMAMKEAYAVFQADIAKEMDELCHKLGIGNFRNGKPEWPGDKS